MPLPVPCPAPDEPAARRPHNTQKEDDAAGRTVASGATNETDVVMADMYATASKRAICPYGQIVCEPLGHERDAEAQERGSMDIDVFVPTA